MATLKFKNVNKIYPNRVQAVFDFNLDVKNNEFIVLVGPSGCGKSTTLRMLAGFEDISTGEIYIDGVKVNKMAPKDRNIAMVFQNYALYPHMTVYDNMAFALKLRKVSKPLFEVDEKNPKYIKEVEEATNKSNEELKEGLDKLKLDRATKNAIKEFKFAKANELKVKIIKIDEKYSKPVYTYDHKKANELEDAINAEVNKVKIAVNTINKEIKKENDKPKVFRDEVALSISREKSEFKLNAKDLNRRIKKERHPNEVEKLKKELAQLSEAHDKKIKELETTLADAKEFTVDQKRIDELNKELEKAKTLVVDQKKVDNLKAELEKVYAKETFQAYSTQHYTSDEIAEKVTEAAEILGLTPYLKRKPAALSGGQRQRVALGRAIVRKPKVFLMDEPLSNLDAKLRVQTRGEIAKIHQRVGATTIYVTHDQTEAMTMADRIVVMKDGYVQQVGTPKEVYAHPSNIFVAGFIGSPSMNFFSGSFDGKNFKFANSDVKFELTKELVTSLKAYKGKEVVMGIRPEDIYFDTDKSLTHKSKPVKVKAELSELLGHEIIIYGNVANQKIIIKTVANKEVSAGDTYAYSYDVTKVHFFDPKTTKCICSATKK